MRAAVISSALPPCGNGRCAGTAGLLFRSVAEDLRQAIEHAHQVSAALVAVR